MWSKKGVPRGSKYTVSHRATWAQQHRCELKEPSQKAPRYQPKASMGYFYLFLLRCVLCSWMATLTGDTEESFGRGMMYIGKLYRRTWKENWGSHNLRLAKNPIQPLSRSYFECREKSDLGLPDQLQYRMRNGCPFIHATPVSISKSIYSTVGLFTLLTLFGKSH